MTSGQEMERFYSYNLDHPGPHKSEIELLLLYVNNSNFTSVISRGFHKRRLWDST